VLFSEKVKTWRKSLNLRQKEAAFSLDVPCGTFRSWEKGKRQPSKYAMPEIERRMKESTDFRKGVSK
jgi:DNA-binding transcriptional regulator YiaG